MDKSNSNWWLFPRWSKAYLEGVDEYIEKACESEARGGEIRCPCKICCFRNWSLPNIVKDHMISKGFIWLPEEHIQPVRENVAGGNGGVNNFDDIRVVNNLDDKIDDLLHDTFRNGPNEETKNFYKLVEEGQQELYPGCKNFSKLSFTIQLFLFKRDNHLSNTAFTELLKILKVVQPDAKLPSSFNEAKGVVKLLGLDYTKIDACPNDCMLYWENTANSTSCDFCKTSRWKSDDEDEVTGKVRRIPAKILRYFPIKKRLQRLFMCPETAHHMTWHAKGRPKDGMLRHPADGEDWKNFDLAYPMFAGDVRNVRLGLASDGFNPFNTMSIVHSTWPVILTNCNLPPWMSMKPENLMLALLIPGPLSPGNDIDVYLQPLVKDLKELWEFGIETFDASTNQMFNMHAALFYTISDFPAYAMLSGWSTKGKFACPCCHYETHSQYLKYSKKTCYMGHRRFLPAGHPYRSNRKQFDGNPENRSAPVRLSGIETSNLLMGFQNKFGKKKENQERGRKKGRGNKTKKEKKKRGHAKEKKDNQDKGEVCPWKKRSIFFELPYWKNIVCRHYLDVMHIEKNVCDSVVGTLSDIPGKTKDHLAARNDLKELNIMPELQPKSVDGQRVEIAKSRFWMTVEEKRMFCRVIKNAKIPKSCSSNIARCVQVQERKITGYKSHDAHFLMHFLLPIAVKLNLHKDVATPLMRLSAFFKAICCKVIDPTDLDYLQSEIAEILSQFERIFPAAFFDVMVHLPIHLVEEIRFGGPVCTRWMYPIERYLRKLKSFVRNKNRPEGSMAEAYLADECVTFCARYLRHSSSKRDEQIETNESQPIFSKMGHALLGKGMKNKNAYYKMDLIKWEQAHQYVLFNCNKEEVERYICEHETLVSNTKKRKWDATQSHSKGFSEWFRERVDSEICQGLPVSDCVRWLSARPSLIAKRYSGYYINGYRFHTMKRDANCVTQNSGVTLMALTPSFASTKDQHPIVGDVSYYGSIRDIIEIFYDDHFSFVLFDCVWFQSEKDSSGLVRINRSRPISQNEPFILACQAYQIFYVEDPSSNDWYFVVQGLPRDQFDSKDEGSDAFADMYWKDPIVSHQNSFDYTDGDAEVSRIRVDAPPMIIDLEDGEEEH